MSKEIMPTVQIQKNETPDFCKGCGGCCKSQPGGYSPDQFSEKQEIIDLLLSGKAIIDYWVGDGNIHYLRPKKKTERDYIAAWWPPEGSCVHLTERGCALSWSQRPHNCRTLKAFAPKQCSSIYEGSPKEMISYAWESSRFSLYEILDEVYRL